MIATTSDGLLLTFRYEVDDAVGYLTSGDGASLWKDSEIYGYMTEALDALLKDTDHKYRVLSLPVVAGDPLVALPRRVLKIREARLVTADRSIRALNANAPGLVMSTMDYGMGTPEAVTSMFTNTGTPTVYVRDYDTGYLRLVPIPIVNDTMEIQCTVTIGEMLVAKVELPTRDMEDLRLVLHYMKGLAYDKQDAETVDPTKAGRYMAMYKAGANERSVRLRSYRRSPGVVRMNW